MSKQPMSLLPITVASLAYFVLGAVWFPLFRQPYLADLGKTAEELAKGPNLLESLGIQLVGNVLMAFVLAWFIQRDEKPSRQSAVKISFLVWLGFIAAFLAPLYAFQAFPLRFFLINTIYPLIGLLLMGAIIGGWKRKN